MRLSVVKTATDPNENQEARLDTIQKLYQKIDFHKNQLDRKIVGFQKNIPLYISESK